MAEFGVAGLDDLMLTMQQIAEIPAEVQDEILNAQADVIVEAQKSKGHSYGVERTGVTLNSIKKSKPKSRKGSRVVYVTPTGTNKDGNRNAEVAFVNNYGTRSQKARPFITDANEMSEEQTTTAGAAVYDRWLKTKGL
jgi:HK97 gp10 family phage protein